MRIIKVKFIQIIFFCFGFFVYANFTNAYYNPGQPEGFVNDYSGTFTIEQKQLLENKLAQFERDSSNEIAVVLINDLQGDTIENFAEKLFKDWGIGKKDKNNGILILLAKNDHETRIEVGYGLESFFTDAHSDWTINKIMKPAFQSEDFYRGIDGAIDKIIITVKGENVPALAADRNQNSNFDWRKIFGIAFFGFIWLAAILGRSKSWWFGGALGAIIGIIIGVIKGFFYFGIIAFAILTPLGLLFDFIVSTQYKASKSRGHVPWWLGGSHWDKGGKSNDFGRFDDRMSDRRGFGGGGRGFGGGMSGGGGSSGKW
jgi:uncharacterized protein